jgi:hypothetical protein
LFLLKQKQRQAKAWYGVVLHAQLLFFFALAVVFLLKQKQAFACSAELCFCLSKNMQSGAEHAKTAQQQKLRFSYRVTKL